MWSRFIGNSLRFFSFENILILYPSISSDSCAFKYNTRSFLGISVFLGQLKGSQIVFVLKYISVPATRLTINT